MMPALIYIYIYMLGDLLSEHFSGRPMTETSNSEEAMGTGACWLQHCVENHPKCLPASTAVPTRLVHVGTSDTEPNLLVGLQGSCILFCILRPRS